ncbi:hypothetical protein GOODEAATRI_031560, partial [Goodea atripinnis]
KLFLCESGQSAIRDAVEIGEFISLQQKSNMASYNATALFCFIHNCCLFLSPPACQTLAVSQLDSVIIAPPGPVEGDNQTLAHLQPVWEELEALVRKQKIAAIGTSDLDKDLLEQLYNWAQVGDNLLSPSCDVIMKFCVISVF